MELQELQYIPVENVMTTDLVTVSPEAHMEEVDELMRANKIHHVPVINSDGELIGIISYSDVQLLKDWGTRLNLPGSISRNAFLLKSNLASDIMTRNLVTIGPDHTLRQCADILKEQYFQALPVVKDSKLVGIVTIYDLMIAAYRDVPINI